MTVMTGATTFATFVARRCCAGVDRLHLVDSATVTLWATIIVAAATVVYASLTFSLLRATRESARAAKDAAEAAALAVRISDATTIVNFDAEYSWQPPLMFLTITPRGANVDVVSVMAHFGKTDLAGNRSSSDEMLVEYQEPGHVIAGDSRMQYTWGNPAVQPSQDDRGHTACVLIEYRLASGAPKRTSWVGADMYLPRGWSTVPMPPSQTSHVIGN